MENFLPPDWSRRGKSLGDLQMSPWSVPPLKTAMRVNQLAGHELRMEMAAGQGQQNGGRCNTNHRGWSSKMVRFRFLPQLICSVHELRSRY